MLKNKIGEQEAEALVEFVDTKVKDGIKEANDQNLKILTTKEDNADFRSELRQDFTNLHSAIKEDIYTLRSESKQDVANLRSEIKQDIANLRTELKTDISNSKTDMIKWIVGFWIVQMAAIIGLYLKK